MTINTKPILYNSYKIKEGLSVKNRVERVFFTDIYLLSDDRYLYLYLNIKPEELVDRGQKYEMVTISMEENIYVGVIIDGYSRENITLIANDLTKRTGFDCIAGMHELKQLLIAEVINPLKTPEKFKKFKVSIPNGIILYGPPGVGKSFIVRKLSEELGYNYVEVKGSDLATPYIHGAVGNIGKAFDMAKQNSPTVLCFNEISALVPDRKLLNESSSHKEEETSEFLTQLEEAADNNILVIGTTNFLEKIDGAVLRPGRFDKKIYVPLPDFDARKGLFKIALVDRPHDENIDFDKLATLTENYSCADIVEGVVETASRMAANLDMSHIDQNILELEIGKQYI